MGRGAWIANLVGELAAGWPRRPGPIDSPVSAVVTASVLDAPYLAITLPHLMRQARFPFTERVVAIDRRMPDQRRGRPHGTAEQLERIVADAIAAGTIDRSVVLDTSEVARREVTGRYFESANGGSIAPDAIYAVLAGLEAARHDLVAWFSADLVFHAAADGWIREGLPRLVRSPATWLVTTHAGPVSRTDATRWLRSLLRTADVRVPPGAARHMLCDRRRLRGRLRTLEAGRGVVGRTLADAVERHRAEVVVVDSCWHLQPASHAPPFAQWIGNVVDAVEHGRLPEVQRDGLLRLHQPTTRAAWRQHLFPTGTPSHSARPTSRPARRAVVRERRPVAGAAPLSVIIPIRDRAGRDVRNSLASLAWQTAGKPWEVIIVSHGSRPEIESELGFLAREAGATLLSVGSPEDPWCKPHALNTGILAADPAISFVMTMDADMMLADNLVECVLADLREDPDRIVLCQSSDLPQDCALPDDPEAIRAQFLELARQAQLRGAYGTGGIQAMRRSFVVEVRGWDEDMLWWGALDTDMVRRAEAAGMRVSWVTERTAMLHQWHPRKHHILDAGAHRAAARDAWLRNHELMLGRATTVVRNPDGWGATVEVTDSSR